MKKILMATDLSDRSDRALERGVLLARRLEATIEVLHVVDDTAPAEITAQYETAAKQTLIQRLASLPAAVDVNPDVALIRGQEFRAILERAAETNAELIILGTTRNTVHELFGGTTAERIVRMGDLPVLMVKKRPSETYSHVLVATDLSPSATRALRVALEIAPGAEFRLLHVLHVPFKGLLGPQAMLQMRGEREQHVKDALRKEVHELAETLQIDPPKTTVILQEGEIHNAIRQQISETRPDLLALGTHGRAGFRHALIGSVALDMLSDPPLDVLVAKA
jgi:nucleotide-binding universal stress UspA family protein